MRAALSLKLSLPMSIILDGDPGSLHQARAFKAKAFPVFRAQIVALQHSLQAITSGNPLLDESIPMGHQGTYARGQRWEGPRLPE